MPHGRADGQNRVRYACGENLGRIAANPHRNDLPVLRRGLRANRALAEWTDRESQFAARPLCHARKSVHQGALWLAIYAADMIPQLCGSSCELHLTKPISVYGQRFSVVVWVVLPELPATVTVWAPAGVPAGGGGSKLPVPQPIAGNRGNRINTERGTAPTETLAQHASKA